MSKIRTRALRRADRENDASISTAEANALIGEQYGELYGVVALDGVGRYFEYSTTFTTAGLSYLDEPTDHMSTVDTMELEVDATTGRCVRLLPLMPQERAMWSGRTGVPRFFDFVDDRINLYPTPPSGKVLTLRYIPQPPDLEDYGDSDVIDVVCPAGEAFLIWGAAALFLSKSSSDLSYAVDRAAHHRELLADFARARLLNESPRIYVEPNDGTMPWLDGDWRYDQ